MYSHKGITYRPYKPEDLMGLAFFILNVTKEKELLGVLECDFELATKNMRDLCETDQGVTLLALENDKIVGCIVLGKTNLWWSSSNFFTDLVFYVDPKYRKGYNIQETLIEKVKVFSDLANIPIILNIFDESNKKLTILKWFNRKGFKTISVSGLYLPKRS